MSAHKKFVLGTAFCFAVATVCIAGASQAETPHPTPTVSAPHISVTPGSHNPGGKNGSHEAAHAKSPPHGIKIIKPPKATFIETTPSGQSTTQNPEANPDYNPSLPGNASDARLKMNITPVAVLPNGLSLYSFQYRRDPTTTYVGVLAQDLLKSKNSEFRKAVVIGPDGYYTVRYDELGLRMLTLDEWRVLRAEVCCVPKAHCSFIQTCIRVPGTTHLASVAH